MIGMAQQVLLACKLLRVASSGILLTSSSLASFRHSYKQRRVSTIAFALHFLHYIKVLLVKTDASTSLAKEEEEYDNMTSNQRRQLRLKMRIPPSPSSKNREHKIYAKTTHK